MTELVRYRDADETAREWIALMAPAVELAKAIAGTEFVPRALRNNPAAIAAAILYGDEVGLGPMQALAKIAVIDGRPALAAEAQRALILRSGGDLWLEEYTTSAVTIAGKRAGAEVTNRVTWTLDDARRAGLAGKPNWRSYPRQMLLARASAELARAMFADVIGGLAALEEFEEPDAAAEPVDAGGLRLAEGAPTTRRRRRRNPAKDTAPAPTAPDAIATTSAPAPEPELAPAPGEPGTATMSDAQRRKLHATFRDRGYGTGSRVERLQRASEIIGREIASASELTADEAARIIAELEGDAAASPPNASAGDHPPAEAPPSTGEATPSALARGDSPVGDQPTDVSQDETELELLLELDRDQGDT